MHDGDEELFCSCSPPSLDECDARMFSLHFQHVDLQMAQNPLLGGPTISSHLIHPGIRAIPPEPTASPPVAATKSVPAASVPDLLMSSASTDLRMDYCQSPRRYIPKQPGSEGMGLGAGTASGSRPRGSGSGKAGAGPAPPGRPRDTAAERAFKMKEKNRCGWGTHIGC